MGEKKVNLKGLSREERQFLPRQRSTVLEQFNEEERTAVLSFASETPVPDYWGDAEILRCDDVSMVTERFKKGVMPVLFNHKRDELIGKPLEIWTENGRALAKIQFATNPKAEEVFQNVRDGFLNGVSVGYRVSKCIYVRENETVDGVKGPAYIAERWEVFEISIVTVPADATVGVGRALPFNLGEDNFYGAAQDDAAKGARNMDDKKNQNPAGVPDENQRSAAPAAPAAGDTEAQRAEARKQERQRCSQINALCRQFNIGDEKREALISEERSIDYVNAEILKVLTQRNAPKPSMPQDNPVVGENRSDAKRELYCQGYLMRKGIMLKDIKDDAKRYAGMSMMDIARDMLLDKNEREAMRYSGDELFARAMTTTALPALLSDIAKASLVEGYQSADTTYEKWVAFDNLPDFREQKTISAGMDEEPVKIPENGEFTEAVLKESTAGMKLDTYGRKWSYTRQAFINDDKNVLITIPRRMGAKFPILINRMAYQALTGGTYTAAVNLGTAGSISTATISEAMKLLRLRKNPLSGEYLRIRPRFLVVPVGLESIAAQFLASTADPSANNSGVKNIYNGALEIISEPELDAISGDAWYLLGEPVVGEGVNVAFLNGNRTPIIESQTSFDTLGWKYRIYLDHGVKLMSTLGYVKNAGK